MGREWLERQRSVGLCLHGSLRDGDALADVGNRIGRILFILKREGAVGAQHRGERLAERTAGRCNLGAERARREGLVNLTAVAGAPDDARLPQKADLILLVNTYHHIEQREAYFRKLAQSLAAALNAAEEMAGETLRQVWLNVSGGQPRSRPIRSRMPL